MPSILKSIKNTIIYAYVRCKIMVKSELPPNLKVIHLLDFWAGENPNVLQALREYTLMYMIYLDLGINKKNRINPIHIKKIMYHYTDILQDVPNTPDKYYDSFLAIKKDWENKNHKIKNILWAKWFRHSFQGQRSFGLRARSILPTMANIRKSVNDKYFVEEHLKPVLSNFDYERLYNYCSKLFKIRVGYSFFIDCNYLLNVNWEKVFGYDESWMTNSQTKWLKDMMVIARKVIRRQKSYYEDEFIKKGSNSNSKGSSNTKPLPNS